MGFKLFDDFTGEEIELNAEYFTLTFTLEKSDGDLVQDPKHYHMTEATKQTVIQNLLAFLTNPLNPPS